MRYPVKDLLILTLLTLFITSLIWLPHLLSISNFWGLQFTEGFNTIYRNFDGLEYIIIAKTFYNPAAIAALQQPLPANYFPSHFPGYAILITIFAPILGYLKSMIFVTLISTVLSVLTFYLLVKEFKLSNHPLLLSFIFLILPARWVIVHSVGSSEPLFIFFILLSIYGFIKYETVKNMAWIVLATIGGIGAQMTRPPGVLLFIAYFLYLLYISYSILKISGLKQTFKNLLSYLPILLIPLSLIALFYWFQITLEDFWAYFHSGDNIHLTFPPFQVFNKQQFWVGDIWLEDIVYTLIFGLSATVLLFKQKLYPMAFFALVYIAASSFVAHRDIARYLLPIAPFTLIAFEKYLTSREFKIILPIILLIIYLYSQNFILANVAPIPNVNHFN